MGLLDHYRQFAGMSDEEISEQLREQADERRRRALTRIDTLDLSRTTWHELPHPEVVNAVTYAARGALNVAPDPTAEELRRELGRRSGVEHGRVAVGHGAAQLLAAAARALLPEPDDELLTPWPSYGLYPVMAQRAGARALPVPGGFDVERLLAAVTPRTRAIALCNPNDPTGERLPSSALRELLGALPEHVSLLLDEALEGFVTAEPDGALALLDDHPRLLVFRTFSKVYGLAGLRVGYALGGPGAEALLARIAPELGVGLPAQVGALVALRRCDGLVAQRRAAVASERTRLLEAVHELPLDAVAGEANVMWLRPTGLTGAELALRLQRSGVLVQSGASVGDEQHVRVTLQSPRATDRLLDALRTALGAD
ncbi:MAG TPA: aminotransferase class I/II-fold pyridoxal phosphate-dependent enzyme [Conexibacter sp.]|nr:aminotransferase class I/II-fold pyridoxal phosphate-dependent enzyme [Conexibacter sp.]